MWTQATVALQLGTQGEDYSPLSAVQVTLDGLKHGTSYDVQVRARNEAGVSEWSEPDVGQTLFPPTPIPVPGSGKPTLTFLERGNDEAEALQTALARTILEYGYAYQTDWEITTYAQSLPELMDGNMDIAVQIWLPEQQEALAEAVDLGILADLGRSLTEHAWQSAFLIPRYTADANPGLRSVEDLKRREYRSLFAESGDEGIAVLRTCHFVWSCNLTNQKQAHGYGLGELVRLSEPGNADEFLGAPYASISNKEDILFFFWWPSVLIAWMNEEHGGVYRLQEPPYSEACWEHVQKTPLTDLTQACAYRSSELHTVVRSELIASAPLATEFLSAWELSGGAMDSLLVAMHTLDRYGVTNAEREAVFHWLRESTEWEAWVADGVVESVRAAVEW